MGGDADLPASSDSLRYGRPEKEEYGYYEDEFFLRNVTDEKFVRAVREGLSTNGFEIRRDDPNARVITADRGLRPMNGRSWLETPILDSVIPAIFKPESTGEQMARFAGGSPYEGKLGMSDGHGG